MARGRRRDDRNAKASPSTPSATVETCADVPFAPIEHPALPLFAALVSVPVAVGGADVPPVEPPEASGPFGVAPELSEPAEPPRTGNACGDWQTMVVVVVAVVTVSVGAVGVETPLPAVPELDPPLPTEL